MKVLDLRCANDHRFEGWFASDADFVSQNERGLVECPLCAGTSVTRLPSAPRLNVAASREAEPAPVPGAPAGPEARMQALWMRAVRRVIESTEDVGERFPEEARRIHYGEVEKRGIRGRASSEDADALREEGIEVSVLPVPPALKGPLQ